MKARMPTVAEYMRTGLDLHHGSVYHTICSPHHQLRSRTKAALSMSHIVAGHDV